MRQIIARIVNEYDRGTISRRELIGHLTMLGAALVGAPVLAQERTATRPASEAGAAASGEPLSSTFTATDIDHVALTVADVPRSRDFYMKHLGLTVRSDGGAGSCFLNVGDDHFLALFRGREVGMHHYCYSVPGYSAESAVEKLKAAGLAPDRRDERVYFPDPDGITVQVAL